MHVPDINADLAEGMANDAEVMKFIHRANLACGGHAGDAVVLRQVLRMMVKEGKLCGPHPGYPDPANFGRVSMNLSWEELRSSILLQIQSFDRIAEELGVKASHVKFHGALYNDAAKDASLAGRLSRLIYEHYGPIKYLGLAGSCMLSEAEKAGLEPISEVFADRRYNPDGTLVSRSLPGAVIHDLTECIDQVHAMVETGKAQTICVHGDGAAAVALAAAVWRYLEERNDKAKTS